MLENLRRIGAACGIESIIALAAEGSDTDRLCCFLVGSQVHKAVEQRERDIAKWATKPEGGDDDDDSLETVTKPRKVESETGELLACSFRAMFVSDGTMVPCHSTTPS